MASLGVASALLNFVVSAEAVIEDQPQLWGRRADGQSVFLPSLVPSELLGASGGSNLVEEEYRRFLMVVVAACCVSAVLMLTTSIIKNFTRPITAGQHEGRLLLPEHQRKTCFGACGETATLLGKEQGNTDGLSANDAFNRLQAKFNDMHRANLEANGQSKQDRRGPRFIVRDSAAFTMMTTVGSDDESEWYDTNVGTFSADERPNVDACSGTVASGQIKSGVFAAYEDSDDDAEAPASAKAAAPAAEAAALSDGAVGKESGSETGARMPTLSLPASATQPSTPYSSRAASKETATTTASVTDTMITPVCNSSERQDTPSGDAATQEIIATQTVTSDGVREMPPRDSIASEGADALTEADYMKSLASARSALYAVSSMASVTAKKRAQDTKGELMEF